jgi:multidrug efflux pump subunit AcrB
MLPLGESLGLSARDVARQLRASFFGTQALRQQRGRNEVKVMVQLPEMQRSRLYDLYALPVRTPAGGYVPLARVARLDSGHAYTTITRRDGRRTVSVKANVEPIKSLPQVTQTLDNDVLPALLEKYPGLSTEYQGRQADARESMQALMQSFIVVLVVLYAALALPLQSYAQPAVVMVAIPFGIIGAFLGHLIMGYGLSIVSMMGILALTGVVVNDTLILIDYANHKRHEGANAGEAIVAAGMRRFRPILLTTITTFGGLAPMIFETSIQARFLIPMAISLGYGILFATFISLALIPALYLILEDLDTLVRRRFPTKRSNA